MRIGVYTGNVFPDAGGAYSLIKTIEKDIVKSDRVHDIFFVFDNDKAPGRLIKNNIVYINIADKAGRFIRIIRKVLLRFSWWNKPWVLDDFLQAEKIDLLWILGPYKLETSIPYVFTVWDLGHRLLPCFPEVSVYGGRQWEEREALYQKMLPKATYIITGNETGKQEILANYPVNPDKIKIIPFPIANFCFDREVTPLDQVKKPFVFYPAQFWAHKNHVAIVEAIAWLRDNKNTVINCYFVGADYGNLDHVRRVINKYHLGNQIFILGFVEYPVLRYLYKNALAMTYVSLMGPNNLPPLEAAVLGCSVIVSNIPGHIEQMGKAGLFVDAFVPQEIGRAILTLYKNPKRCRELISNGLVLAKKYKNYSYFQEMLRIIEQYTLQYKTWAV
jgi:glycosyltransferase involved in cell wall biosynthesis